MVPLEKVVLVVSYPRNSGEDGDDHGNGGDDSSCDDCTIVDVGVHEEVANAVDEPRRSGDGTARMDATQVLQSRCCCQTDA